MKRMPLRRMVWPGILAVMALFVAGCNDSVDDDLETSARDLIDRTVAACRAGNWAEAAGYFAYSGSDPTRRYSDVYNPVHEQELMRVKSGGCGGLFYAFPGLDIDYAFGSLSIEKDDDRFWYMQELTFPDDRRADPAVVVMLEIEGRLAIGDID